MPETWDDEVDLVIVGSGSAGLTGAVVAAVCGASVAVLEKAEVVGGTTALSGGGFWVPANHHMAEREVADSPEEALEYMRACAGDQGEDEIVVALVDHGPEMVRFLEERAGMAFRPWPAVGGTIDYRPWLPGWKPGARTLDAGKFPVADLGEWGARVRRGDASAWLMDKFDYYAGRMHVSRPAPAQPTLFRPSADLPEFFAAGTALIGQLLRGCLEHGVAVHTGTPARELVVDGGRVVGVRAQRSERDVFVRARGVLVASGGYAVDEALKRLWLTRPLEETCEAESNTGDGHLMGIAVGAGVAGLGDAWWIPHVAVGRNADGSVAFAASREDRSVPHTMIVNRSGRRFMNESINYYDAGEYFGTKEGGAPRNRPAWLILDTQGREKYAILAFKFPGGAVPDWMTSADSLPELAGKLEIDASELEATTERFNGFARTGVDLDFHRGESEWDIAWGDPSHRPNPALGTIEQPPFYALELRSGALSTRGGLRVNAHAEVVSALPPFQPIAGLYAAGNCSSAGVAGAYTGAGATIGAAMTFAYLAGRRVAATLAAAEAVAS